MSGKLTDLQQLRQTALEAKGLIADVASAAADAIGALEGSKQDRLTGQQGQVVGFDATGKSVALDGLATGKFVEDLLGDIESALAVI